MTAHAEICPVCKGHGRITMQMQCHGCDGYGWVTVEDGKTNRNHVVSPLYLERPAYSSTYFTAESDDPTPSDMPLTNRDNDIPVTRQEDEEFELLSLKKDQQK